MTPLTERPALTMSGAMLAAFLRGLLPEAHGNFDDQIDAIEQEAVARYKAELREAVEGLHPRWRLRDGTPETWVPINAVLALLSTPEPGEPR